ncbi:MAG: stage III sporulation protein AE [Clostridia bacterium]|nr:stage III sporulation protein AE [Clostridiales bacterium]MDD7166038.1 stage III sporulation protein AE [Clostridia bacterium]MDY2900922.1 stage III sporulation protein AE [Christensenellaceae bacterium]
MKKKIIIFLIIPLFILLFSTNYVYAKADSIIDNAGNADEIESIADEIYNGLDTSEIEKYLADLIPPFASGGSLKDFIKRMIKSESENYETLFDYLISLVTSAFREQLPAFVSLFVLIVFASLLKIFAPSDKSGAGELANYAIFTAIICIVAGVVYGTIAKAESTLDKLSGFIEAVYPIVMTLTVACGATNSSLTVTPAALFVSNTVIVLVKNVFFPIIVFMFVASIVSNLNKSIKLKNLFGFLSTFMKWAIGLFTVVFSFFLGLNGLNSGYLDGLGYKTAKYALGTTLPLVGSVVGEGMNLIVASAAIIKNALGALTVLIVFSVAVIPIIEIIVLTLVLKLIAAVTEPFSDGRTGEFISGGISVINFVIAALVIVTFMYIVTFVAVIGCTGYVFS